MHDDDDVADDDDDVADDVADDVVDDDDDNVLQPTVITKHYSLPANVSTNISKIVCFLTELFIPQIFS